MSNHMELMKSAIDASAVKVAAEGIRMAVALTDDELVTARAGFLGRWGSKVERFSLGSLSDVRFVPNPSANLLQLEFNGSPPKSLIVMFEPKAAGAFEPIIHSLRERVTRRGNGAG
jgi:hypothetical protein